MFKINLFSIALFLELIPKYIPNKKIKFNKINIVELSKLKLLYGYSNGFNKKAINHNDQVDKKTLIGLKKKC